MSALSINAEDTAPVPAKMSATEVISGHCSSTTFVINGNSLYLLPKYRRLLMDDVRYVRACSNSALLVGIRLKIVSLPRYHNLLQCCAKTAYLLRSEEVLTSLKRFQERGKDLSTPLKMTGGRLRSAMEKWDNSTIVPPGPIVPLMRAGWLRRWLRRWRHCIRRRFVRQSLRGWLRDQADRKYRCRRFRERHECRDYCR